MNKIKWNKVKWNKLYESIENKKNCTNPLRKKIKWDKLYESIENYEHKTISLLLRITTIDKSFPVSGMDKSYPSRLGEACLLPTKPDQYEVPMVRSRKRSVSKTKCYFYRNLGGSD